MTLATFTLYLSDLISVAESPPTTTISPSNPLISPSIDQPFRRTKKQNAVHRSAEYRLAASNLHPIYFRHLVAQKGKNQSSEGETRSPALSMMITMSMSTSTRLLAITITSYTVTPPPTSYENAESPVIALPKIKAWISYAPRTSTSHRIEYQSSTPVHEVTLNHTHMSPFVRIDDL
jgi:hypothetical protein